MTKRQLEKVRKNFESVDFSRWHILSYDEMLKVNGGSGTDDSDEEEDVPEEAEVHVDVSDEETVSGEEIEDDVTAEDEPGGHEVENSHSAVAGAEPGDTITREDGTEITLTGADIEYEQNYCNEHGIDWGKDDELPQENPEANGGDALSAENAQGEEILNEMSVPETSGEGDEDTCAASSGQEDDSNKQVYSGSEEISGNASKGSDDVKENPETDETKTSDDGKNIGTEDDTKKDESAVEAKGEQNGGNAGKDSGNPANESIQVSNPANGNFHNAAIPDTGKEEHGFFDSVKDFFSDVKDWVADLFGFVDGEKKGENAIIESFDERIRNSMVQHWDESYKKGVNDCDIWVENVIKDTGIDLSDKWGSAYTNDVKNHEIRLEGLLSDIPTGNWNVVLMTEPKNHIEWSDHTGILETHFDGSVSFYENTSRENGPTGTNYPSVESFESDFGYNDFDYYEVK